MIVVQPVLKPFLEQSIEFRSGLVVEKYLGETALSIASGLDRVGVHTQSISQVSGSFPAADLLCIGAHALDAALALSNADLPVRGMAVLLTPEDDGLGWKLQVELFDRGYIAIGSANLGTYSARCFLQSDCVRHLPASNIETRGYVACSDLLEGARFANWLFRYACVRLYASRHGLTPAVPDWEGRTLFGLNDRTSDGLSLQRLVFPGFADNDREIWTRPDPPLDVDLAGYFQEIPDCWKKHRDLLRNLFRLRSDYAAAMDRLRDRLTNGGRSTLVAVHVRRGDYRMHQNAGAPWFRFVPESWYVDWLRSIWPTLRDPVLYVATDEPEAVLPAFQEFRPVHAVLQPGDPALPDHVRDFELLRRSAYLAICNSSFSRMAAILAPEGQQCVIPVFQTQRFVPYEPWEDSAFWDRFADSWNNVTTSRSEPARTLFTQSQTGIVVDVTDLVLYLLHHDNVSGIQRVQCELMRHFIESPASTPVRFVAMNERGLICEVDGAALLEVVDRARADTSSREQQRTAMRELLHFAGPFAVRPHDVFLMLGAFWGINGMGRLLRYLKDAGVVIGVFIHDLIPIVASEYAQARSIRLFAKGVIQALTFADFILTTSEFNRGCITGFMSDQRIPPRPIHLTPLAHSFPASHSSAPKISTAVQQAVEAPFVLCVGTIEVRKNPTYLFNLWKLMDRNKLPDTPNLVFAGRKGWMAEDFFEQVEASRSLGGKIVMLHDVNDVELDFLYEKCLLTIFPSFVEGWGLPVGESLSHGKICLCSAEGGISEIAPGLADFIDPYNVHDAYRKLLNYLQDPELRRRREREIAERFHPRTWKDAADGVLRSACALARRVETTEAEVAVNLPASCYLPINNSLESMPWDSLDGRLATDLICNSGWRVPEATGVRPARRSASIRFRTGEPAGSRINLVLRFSAYGAAYRVRIRSGSGAETDVDLQDGSERAAVLPCQVEQGQLVTATISQVETILDAASSSADSHWVLRGVLYFNPRRLAGEVLKKGAVANVQTRAATAVGAPVAATPQQAAVETTRASAELRPVSLDKIPRASSFGAFLRGQNLRWTSAPATAVRDAPIFANAADRDLFYSLASDSDLPGKVTDTITLVRRSEQIVSMSRFSEGSVFDRSGVTRGYGFLEAAPPEWMPWGSRQHDCVRISEDAIAAAPAYEGAYLIFFNGNLHNYYHWVAEALLGLDVLSASLGFDAKILVPIPKSLEVAAVLDHRDSLRAAGLNAYRTVEIEHPLVRLEEAVWVDNDLVQNMPAAYVKDFQKRVAGLYAGVRGPRNRRILVGRRGPTRMIQNMEQVEESVSRFGFETVYLEGMSVRDQILLFQSAEFVIGAHGAGMANLLFCEPRTRVIEIMPTAAMRPFFWVIAEKLELVHGMLFASTTPGSDFQSSVHVDVNKLDALIRMVGAHL